MSNFPYLPHYFLPTSMIIISFVIFFDLSIFTIVFSKMSWQKWLFRNNSWQRCYHSYPFCAALLVYSVVSEVSIYKTYNLPVARSIGQSQWCTTWYIPGNPHSSPWRDCTCVDYTEMTGDDKWWQVVTVMYEYTVVHCPHKIYKNKRSSIISSGFTVT